MQIQNNIIHSAHLSDIQKLLFLGSSCIYPKFSNQPISEKSLLSGYLESTNQPYAIAKIAGLIMCDSFNKQYNRDYRVVMPTNLYGPGDNFHSCNSHVIPSLISRINKAKNNNSQKVEIWGTGKVMREFLFVDDMADACVFVMNLSKKKLREKLDLTNLHINVGTGKDISIKKLALLIKKIIGYEGKLYFDPFKPEGTPRKLLNVDVLTKLGWSYKVSLEEGLKISYQWYLRNYS